MLALWLTTFSFTVQNHVDGDLLLTVLTVNFLFPSTSEQIPWILQVGARAVPPGQAAGQGLPEALHLRMCFITSYLVPNRLVHRSDRRHFRSIGALVVERFIFLFTFFGGFVYRE